MTLENLQEALRIIQTAVRRFDDTLATEASVDEGPFAVLISCILSQRTKEEVTGAASGRLLSVAPTVYDMQALSEDTIGSLIYPVGFWKTKARAIRQLCRILIERHNGTVPSTMEELLALPGVGRKTANLVLSVGFNIPAICVDTHVHRIMNRLGFVRTATPHDTEAALRSRLPQNLWIDVNYLLVMFGRNVCTPVSPFCSLCEVRVVCEQVGVSRSR